MPFILTENRIAYVQEGQLLAEATFPEFAPGVVNIDHTFVDEALRGQGVAAQMMERIARSLREPAAASERREYPVPAKRPCFRSNGKGPRTGAPVWLAESSPGRLLQTGAAVERTSVQRPPSRL